MIPTIARIWRGRTTTAKADEYAAYLYEEGIRPLEEKALGVEMLREDRAAFVRGMTDKLFTYALGRGLERYDRALVAAVADRMPAKNYRFSQLVLEVVNSYPFQMRRSAVLSASSAQSSSGAKKP